MTRRAGALLRVVLDWFRNPACPWCGVRTPHLEAHFHVDHAGWSHGGRP